MTSITETHLENSSSCSLGKKKTNLKKHICFFRKTNCSSFSRKNPLHFMASKELLPQSQEPASCPYFEPDQHSVYPHLRSSRAILILSSYPYLVLPSDYFPSGFRSKTCVRISPIPYMLHDSTTSFYFDHPNNILFRTIFAYKFHYFASYKHESYIISFKLYART